MKVDPVKTLVLIAGDSLNHGVRLPYEGMVVYWDKLEVPPGALSVPMMVEESAETLCSEYLDWCGVLARVQVGKESLAAALRSDLLGGGSLWWTTLVAQRSPMASPVIYDVFKLRVLEKLYVAGSYQRLCCVGAGLRLEGVLRRWCKLLRHDFLSQRREQPRQAKTLPGRRWTKRLPHPLRALFSLGHFLLTRYVWIFGAGKGRAKPLHDGDLAIVTYFPDINLAAAKTGNFRSNFWGPLHGLIRELGLKVNWIWLYAQAPAMSYRESVVFRRGLNRQTETTGQRHLMLEDRLKLSGLLSAIQAYIGLVMTSFRLAQCREHFRFPGGALNFFEFLKDDWYSSLRGTVAMETCLHAAAFRDVIGDLPSTTARMIYIWENQGWELSLLHAWRNRFNTPALGFVHSYNLTAVMNLRAYPDRNPVASPYCRPHPDKLITVGEVPSNKLRQWGWPGDIVTEAEALRYMSLLGKYGVEGRNLPETGRHLLVITGYMHSETEAQLRLLAAAAQLGALRAYSQVTIKPHPDTPVDKILADLLFDPPPRVTSTPLSELFADADVVFAANSTSAAIEAAWVGLPLVLMAAIGEIDLNALRGMQGVDFVATAADLEKQLNTPVRVGIPPDCYCLDSGLARWKALLQT